MLTGTSNKRPNLKKSRHEPSPGLSNIVHWHHHGYGAFYLSMSPFLVCQRTSLCGLEIALAIPGIMGKCNARIFTLIFLFLLARETFPRSSPPPPQSTSPWVPLVRSWSHTYTQTGNGTSIIGLQSCFALWDHLFLNTWESEHKVIFKISKKSELW